MFPVFSVATQSPNTCFTVLFLFSFHRFGEVNSQILSFTWLAKGLHRCEPHSWDNRDSMSHKPPIMPLFWKTFHHSFIAELCINWVMQGHPSGLLLLVVMSERFLHVAVVSGCTLDFWVVSYCMQTLQFVCPFFCWCLFRVMSFFDMYFCDKQLGWGGWGNSGIFLAYMF